MRILLSICLAILICAECSGQNEKGTTFLKESIQLKENTIYIFARGTTTKSGIIAHAFNIADTNITHVGIGFYEGHTTRIYNVADVTNKTGALLIDSLETFISGEDVYYFEIWEATVTDREFITFRKCLKKEASKHIVFDSFFKLQDDDTLYCSEFCNKILQKTDISKFNFKPSSVLLNNPLYENILGRKKLLYFPVDFFEQNKYFKKIFEFSFKKQALK